MNGIKVSLIIAVYVISSFAEVINLEAVLVTGLREKEKVLNQALSISKKEKKEIEIDQVVFQKDLLEFLNMRSK